MSRFDRADLSEVTTYPLADRKNKVSVDDFAITVGKTATVLEWLDALPNLLAAKDLRRVAELWIEAARAERTVILAIGGHPIKCGLGSIISDLVAADAITAIAMNGSAVIHDYEIALIGGTSEDVAASLHGGSFGFAEETGRDIHAALAGAQKDDRGFGEAIGDLIESGELPHADKSILAACSRHSAPATVHVALGTDIIHQHPAMDGATVGELSHRDFLLFTNVVRSLDDGGLFINLGSAVIMPEVFLKALSICQNTGTPIARFNTVNMDMIQHYRPGENVVKRPTLSGGEGFRLTGHHEIMFPLLAHAVLSNLGETSS